MQITILGATGFVGRRLLEEALALGYEVKVLVRAPAKLGSLADKVELVVGDYFDEVALRTAVAGSDGVLTTIGAAPGWGGGPGPEEYGRVMARLVAVMKAQGIKRLVHLASAGTRLGREPVSVNRHLVRALVSLVAPKVIPSKERELKVLCASGLNWTSLRPPLIQAKVAGELMADNSRTQGARVDCGQLVRCMLESLRSDLWSRQAPFVGTRIC